MSEALVLWKAGLPGWTEFGHLSSWAGTVELARRYLDMRGFGGPVMHRAEVNPADFSLLDLRVDPWRRVATLGLFDRGDYPYFQQWSDHLRDKWRVVAAYGYDLVLFNDAPLGTPERTFGDEYLYLGCRPIPVARVVDPA